MERTVFFGLILLIVLGSSSAQDQNCCTPDQWEGLISTTPGISEEISLHYDYTNQRSALFVNKTDPSGQLLESNETLLLSSAPGTVVQYLIDLKTRKCTVDKESTPFPKLCIPDSYKKLAEFTLGAANESLPVSLYETNYKEPNATVQSSLIFTRDLCIPVSELHSVIYKEDSVVAAQGYFHIKLGISDPSVFTVPPECQSHTTLFAEKSSSKFPCWRSLASPFLHL